MLVYVFIKPTYSASDVTTFAESAVYVLYIFANNFGSKEPIGLRFHALSHEKIKNFIANVLYIYLKYRFDLSFLFIVTVA